MIKPFTVFGLATENEKTAIGTLHNFSGGETAITAKVAARGAKV